MIKHRGLEAIVLLLVRQGRLWKLIVLAFGFGQAANAIAQDWFVNGSYSYEVSAYDDYVAPAATSVFKQGGNSVFGSASNNIVEAMGEVDGTVGQSSETVLYSLYGQVGTFNLFASSISNAQRDSASNPLYRVNAGGNAKAEVDLSDYVTIKSRHVGPVVLHANWVVNGNISANTTGLVSAGGTYDSFDYVESTAASWLNVTGTGVVNGPYPAYVPGYGSGPYYGSHYSTSGGIVSPTFDHAEDEPPSEIPVTITLTPGQDTNVHWEFDVGAVSSVVNSDLGLSNGFATGVSEFSHTVTWGGITSVTDADTGEAITDWSVSSASGFDYSMAVPEPTTAAMCLIGVALLSIRAGGKRFLWAVRRAFLAIAATIRTYHERVYF